MFCYGAYERVFLKRMRKQAKRKAVADGVLNALFNILSMIYSHVYFPTYSNGLKDIGGCLGFSWSEPDASGIQSIFWRRRWEDRKSDEWKQKLTTYNLEDCAALKKVTEAVYAVLEVPPPTDPGTRKIGDSPSPVFRRWNDGKRAAPGNESISSTRTSTSSTSERISTIRGSGCSCGAAGC